MYAPFSDGLAPNGEVVVPGSYKLMVTTVNGTWTYDFGSF